MDKAAFVTESNVLTSDGVLHVTDKLLIPDDIEPLLPRYCNGKKFSNVSRDYDDSDNKGCRDDANNDDGGGDHIQSITAPARVY